MNTRYRLLISLLVATLVAGCAPAKTPEELLADARQYRSKGELKAALIEAKNALQLAPDHPEAHFLKGALYLDLGEASLAEEELRLALSLKMDSREVIPVLARSLVKQGKFQDALDETVPERFPTGGNSAEVAALRGDAYLGLRRIPAAKAAYESALQYDADFPGALVGLAKITAADRRPEEGMKLLERALAKSPSNFDALLLAGDLQRVLRNPQAALAAYEKAVAQKSDDLNARLTLASIQIGLDKTDDATANLAVVLKEAPQSPTANYMQAMIEFRKKNFTTAQNLAVEVLKVQPTHMPSVILAGAAEYAIGEYAAAERHLKWALDLHPDNLYVRRLLVATYGKNKKVQSAIDTLQVGLKQAPQDANLLALAGDVYMDAKQYARATQYLELAIKAEPQSIDNKVAASASRLAAGELDRVVADLEPVVAANPAQAKAGILLAMAQLRRGEFDKTLELMARLEREMPGNPVVRNLKGTAYVGKKDYAKAKRAFDEAMSLQPSYFPAAANLAQLDINEKNFSGARNRYFAVLERDGSNVEAMLAIAELLVRMPDQMEESIGWVQRARAIQPRDPRIALILAKYQLASGNRERALETTRQASTLGEFDVGILEDAVRLQLAAGATRDAMETYQKVARLKPTSAETQFRLASMQYMDGAITVAKQTLLKALELNPDQQDALMLLAKLEATVGNRESALKLVDRMKKLAPNSMPAYALEGDVEMLGKRYPSAAKAYERAYAIAKRGILAAQVHQAYLRAGKPEQGEAVVLKWLQDNPADAATRQYLADTSMRVSRLAIAIPQYEWLAENQPNSQQVLNNLALAYSGNSDARALATSEKAFKINENNPAAADTFGWMLYRNGQIPEAVDVLRRAVAAAPESREIRFHFAQALAKSGERKEARAEVQRVLSGSTPFEHKADAQSLLEQLKN